MEILAASSPDCGAGPCLGTRCDSPRSRTPSLGAVVSVCGRAGMAVNVLQDSCVGLTRGAARVLSAGPLSFI